MINRQRVIQSINHQQSDRVPMEFWAVEEVWGKMKKHFNTTSKEEILQNLDIDIRDYTYAYKGPALKRFDDGSFLSPFGTHMKFAQNEFGTYMEHASFPLSNASSIDDINKFKMPSVDMFDLENLSDMIGDKHEKYYIRVQSGCVYELAWGLRNMENLMVDFIEEPEMAHALLTKICDFVCEYIEKMLELAGDKIDMVYGYDDIGGQNSLLLSPAMIDEFILPYHKRINSVIKKFDKAHMYHSCGAVFPVIGKLFDIGIDVLNPLQSNAAGMDIEKIKQTYGDKGTFLGGIDIQQLLPKATSSEVYQKTIETLDVMYKNGGYILSSAHRIQADTPVENILAVFEAGKNYNKY